MPFYASKIGCGCMEYSSLYPDVKEHVYSASYDNTMYQALRGFGGSLGVNLVLFGDGVAQGNGNKLAKWITDKGFGKVTTSEIVPNPQHTEPTHQGYQVWLWYIDRKAVKEWYDVKLKEEKEKLALAEKELAANKPTQLTQQPIPAPDMAPPNAGGYRYGYREIFG